MTIRFDGRVAIVTGAGNGLGRAHALGLASRGAKVVVNDFGGARDGTGGSLSPAEAVVEEIRKAGGIAMPDGADVSNFEQVTAMVERATKEWGSVDVLCANAGILRDKAEEGRKNNIRVNTISPTAATRMTEELLPPQALALMRPEAITPAVEFLLSEDAPTRTIMGAGAGSFAVIKILETEGVNLPASEWTPDAIAAHFAEISDMSKAKALQGAFEQTQKYVAQAAE